MGSNNFTFYLSILPQYVTNRQSFKVITEKNIRMHLHIPSNKHIIISVALFKMTLNQLILTHNIFTKVAESIYKIFMKIALVTKPVLVQA